MKNANWTLNFQFHPFVLKHPELRNEIEEFFEASSIDEEELQKRYDKGYGDGESDSKENYDSGLKDGEEDVKENILYKLEDLEIGNELKKEIKRIVKGS